MPRVWSGSRGTAVGFKGPESEGPWSLSAGSAGREEEGGLAQIVLICAVSFKKINRLSEMTASVEKPKNIKVYAL